MQADEQEILAANARFYQAFADSDLSAMDELWAREESVGCIHPGWSLLSGRESIMSSWRAILRHRGGIIAFSEPSVHLRGTMGMVVCREHIGEHVLLATNVFVRENGRWSMIHHHAAPVMPEDEDEDEELDDDVAEPVN
jgi:ketosteroid isomerase-like protein